MNIYNKEFSLVNGECMRANVNYVLVDEVRLIERITPSLWYMENGGDMRRANLEISVVTFEQY